MTRNCAGADGAADAEFVAGAELAVAESETTADADAPALGTASGVPEAVLVALDEPLLDDDALLVADAEALALDELVALAVAESETAEEARPVRLDELVPVATLELVLVGGALVDGEAVGCAAAGPSASARTRLFVESAT